MKIISIKDINGKSGIEYVCKKVKDIDPECIHFKKTVRNVFDATKTNLPELVTVFDGFFNQTNLIRSKCNVLVEDKDDEWSHAYSQISVKIDEYSNKLAKMKDRFEGVKTEWKRQGDYFGIRKDDEKMEDTTKYFTFWTQFFDALDKHWPKEKKTKTSAPGSGGKVDSMVQQKGMRMLI